MPENQSTHYLVKKVLNHLKGAGAFGKETGIRQCAMVTVDNINYAKVRNIISLL